MSAQPDNVNARIVATVGICGAIITWAIIMWLQGVYGRDQDDEDFRKRSMMQKRAYNALVAEQRNELAGYRSPEGADATAYGVPIDRAMELVVRDVSGNPGAATPEMPAGAVPAGAPDASAPSDVDGGAGMGATNAPSTPPGVKAVAGQGNAQESAADNRGRGTERDPAADPKTLDEGKDRTTDGNVPKKPTTP